MPIFDGIGEMFDEWLGIAGQDQYGTRLGVPKYESRQAAIDLSERQGSLSDRPQLDAAQVIQRAMEALGTNIPADDWRPAGSNWKWEKSLKIASHNPSQEKTLEKLTAFLLDDGWVNQVPVCNGLVAGGGADACRIDLAHRVADREYELIELKFGTEGIAGSDHPLFAAMEVVRYGLMYLLFRQRRFQLQRDHHMLRADRIKLIVLAPAAWYRFKRRGEANTKILREGDILVVEGHANPAEIGRAARVSNCEAGMSFQNHLFRVRVNDENQLRSKFLVRALNSERVRRNWVVLKDASLFGFTGTPIELDDHNTPRAFGRELSTDDTGVTRYERYLEPRYSIADSIRDGATLPLHWQPSPRDWKLWGDELDAKFEKEFADLPEGEREQLKKENAVIDVMVKLPERIADIAQEVAEHFQAHVRPNRFKAMLVCYNKETVALYKAALDGLLGPEASIAIFSDVDHRDKDIPQSVKDLDMPAATRAKAIREFKKLPSDKPEDQAKAEQRWRRAEIIIVCDMLLTGFDAPIVQTMYLDKGLKNHTLLQAIARVNRPYDEVKKHGIIVDFWGVFSHLNEALRYDKAELGDAVFPLRVLREEFKLHIETLLDLLKGFDRRGAHDSVMAILKFFHNNEPARDKFENGFHQVRTLYEVLEPDDFLMPYRADYVWLCKLYMVYRKKFYPLQKFETAAEDGAKTRELIREHVEVDRIKQEFPTYVLDENYLTKLDDLDPDAKALDIEAMLAAELKIRIDAEPEAEALSEKLKRIINHKRNGSLQGIALISALEGLTKEVVELINEGKRPVAESIAEAAHELNPSLIHDQTAALAARMLEKARESCFPNWYLKSDVKQDLFLNLTTTLVQEFREAGLHVPATGFVDRVIRLLERTRFMGESSHDSP